MPLEQDRHFSTRHSLTVSSPTTTLASSYLNNNKTFTNTSTSSKTNNKEKTKNETRNEKKLIRKNTLLSTDFEELTDETASLIKLQSTPFYASLIQKRSQSGDLAINTIIKKPVSNSQSMSRLSSVVALI